MVCLTNRVVRDPYATWCERRTPSVTTGGAVYSIVHWAVSVDRYKTTSLCRLVAVFKSGFFDAVAVFLLLGLNLLVAKYFIYQFLNLWSQN